MHCFIQGPIISTFGTSSSTTGTSIAVADRSAPMTANVGLVSIDVCHVDYHDSSLKRSVWFLCLAVHRAEQLCPGTC